MLATSHFARLNLGWGACIYSLGFPSCRHEGGGGKQYRALCERGATSKLHLVFENQTTLLIHKFGPHASVFVF